MKAQRRHELQTNTLSIALAKIADFVRRRSNYIGWGAVGVVVVVVVIVLIARSRSAEADRRQAEFDRCIVDPASKLEDLKALATQTSDKRLAALACVALGDRTIRDVAFDRSSSPAERNAGAEEAAKWYRKVIDEFPKETLAVGKAHFGLGKLAESSRNFPAARAEYEEILRTSALAGEPLVELANESLQNVTAFERERPVAMATTLPTQPTTASGPATSPAATAPAGELATKAVTDRPKEPATRPSTSPRATTQPAGPG